MKRILAIGTIILIFNLITTHIALAQQETIRVMSYNLLEYTNNTDSMGYGRFRDKYFRKVLFTDINPDIISAVELTGSAPADTFLTDVLNYSTQLYNRGSYVPDGTHSDGNALYYNNMKFTFLGTRLIIPESSTTNHPSYEYQLYNNLTGDKITIFGVHFTSNSANGTPITTRAQNAHVIRSISDSLASLPNTEYFITAGDCNFYSGGSEPAYDTLLYQTSVGLGYFFDPLHSVMPLGDDWSSSSYSQYYTISTRSSSFAGSNEAYGLKYRIDLILNSNSVNNSGGSVTYNTGSFVIYGNDGQHYHKSILDSPTNSSVIGAVDTALYYASDHLPVYADYTFSSPSNANPPYQGSIAFTQVGVSDGNGSHPDEIEFVTLYRMNLTSLKITNNVVNSDGTLSTGGGTFDLSNTIWTDVPAGTHIRLGSTLTNDDNASDGILAYNGTGSPALPVFNSSGSNQVIAYTGSTASPNYVAGLHWGTSGGWSNSSFAPGTSSDIALGTLNNYYFSGSLTGTLYTDRNNLINPNNWTGSSSWVDYYSQPLPVELSSFTGNLHNGVIDLHWQTATELNDYGFEIERSADKISWSDIGFVPGNGNSNSPKFYSFIDRTSPVGTIYYRLKQIDTDGKFEYSSILELNYKTTTRIELSQNYPNPFNPVSTIGYIIPTNGMVSLKVYDILGREVATLVDQMQNAGKHSVNFNGSNLASGIYFYVLSTDKIVLSKKMNLLK